MNKDEKVTVRNKELSTFTCTIVVIQGVVRCVCVNNYRLVGDKPYVSEGSKYKQFVFTLESLQNAFPELEIRYRSRAELSKLSLE